MMHCEHPHLPPFLSASSGWQFPLGLLWAPMTNFYVFIKNKRGEFLLCHHSLWLWWEGDDRMAVGISDGVILGFDVLVFPVGY